MRCALLYCRFSAFVFGLALLASACSRPSDRREYTLQGQILSIAPDHTAAPRQARRHQGLHVGDDDALQGARTRRIDEPRAGRSHQCHAGRRQQRRVSEGREEGRATRRSRSRRPKRRMPPASSGFELLKPGEPVPDADVRRSGRQDSAAWSVSRARPSRHVHLHEVPDADVLPADGSPLRDDSEEVEGREERAEGRAC